MRWFLIILGCQIVILADIAAVAFLGDPMLPKYGVLIFVAVIFIAVWRMLKECRHER